MRLLPSEGISWTNDGKRPLFCLAPGFLEFRGFPADASDSSPITIEQDSKYSMRAG